MNDHDLSLLTDEEREAVKWTENTGDGPLARGAQLFLRSLIAARAENKRLRKFEISAEVVRLAWLKDDTSLLDRALALLRDVAEQCTGHEVADKILNVVGDASGDDLDKFDLLDIADKAWAGDDYGYTLLQSEKGGAE